MNMFRDFPLLLCCLFTLLLFVFHPVFICVRVVWRHTVYRFPFEPIGIMGWQHSMKKNKELTASATTAIDGFGIRCKFRCWTRIRTWTTSRSHLVLYFGCHGQECLNIDQWVIVWQTVIIQSEWLLYKIYPNLNHLWFIDYDKILTCSTFVLFLAEVSKNGILSESAYSLAVV